MGHADRELDGTESALSEGQPVDRPRALDIQWDYMESNVPNADLQERTMEKPKAGQNRRSMVISGFARGRDSVRRSKSARGTSLDSQSPTGLGRPLTPLNRWLHSNPFSLCSKPGKIIIDKGKATDMDSEHKHPSDDALASPTDSQGDGCLPKDLDANENSPIESSKEEGAGFIVSSDSKAAASDSEKKSDVKTIEDKQEDISPIEHGPLKAVLSSAEREKASKKSNGRRRSSFECSTSTVNTPFGSDDEADLSDIRRAQQLTIQMSAIDSSIPNRSVRTIVRGDFHRIAKESEDGDRKQRKCLVATDLTEESVYALECTIGSILRDGDTMFAVYATNEEKESGRDTDVESARTSQDGGSQTEDESASNDPQAAYLPRAFFGRFGGASHQDNKTSSFEYSHGSSKMELERTHAVDTITQTCLKLLRKTLLQVRIAVEVIHCKSPKHMITEAIDELGPSLVVVGARDRSALRGVLLGSFSNYLVTKSSVPVTVARKGHSKHKANIRFANNLIAPRGLPEAKVD